MAFLRQQDGAISLKGIGRRVRGIPGRMQGVISQFLTRLGWRSPRRQQRWIAFSLGILTLLLVLIIPPVQAQNEKTTSLEKAPVVVNGQVLFEVGGAGSFTAAERAEKINTDLRQIIRWKESPLIVVDSTGKLTTIKAESQRQSDSGSEPRTLTLVTITSKDVFPGAEPDKAQNWRDTIERKVQQGRWERTSDYRRQALIIVAGVIAIAVMIHLALSFLDRLISHRLRQWLARPTLPVSNWESSSKLLLKLTFLGLQMGLWGAVGFYISDLFPKFRSWRYQLGNFLNSPILPLGQHNYSAQALLLLAASIVGLWFLVNALTRFLESYVLRQTGADPALQEAITTLTKYILLFLGLIVLLQIWKFDVSSFTILASILGVGIGFGVQNIANNFISGLIITVERPIQVGDFVNVGDLTGTVARIGARSTEICTRDRVTIILPNSQFLENAVINWSHGDSISRLRIPVGVAYSSNISKVKLALFEAARTHPDVLVSPKPQVWFQEFGDSALVFELLVWTGDPKQQPRIKSDLNYRIEASLRRHEIEVPFPQRDLNVRSPHLDTFMHTWIQRHASPSLSSQNPLQNQEQLSQYTAGLPAIAAANSHSDTDTDTDTEVTVTTTIQKPQLTEPELKTLAQQMQGDGGVDIKDHHYRANIFPNSFTGSNAVAWLIQTQDCTREGAIAIGQQLMARNLIHHVLDQAPFQDGYLFYRFNQKGGL
ncbi:MAG: mechanosensitive ion channel [Leptolyngbyaceae cyanobacterium MO_188.B28]|nr:mechanosensitive ion channel [Leptolyngbyaceae cyanobacterium MO_188.B28]